MKSKHSALMERIESEPKLTDEVDAELKAAVGAFFETVAD